MKKKINSKKIKSNYVLDSIFNYIKDTKYKLKLFFYSKSFQKKIGLKLCDYQLEYFNKIGINFSKYLKYPDINNNNDNNDKQNFDKNFLNQKLKYDLSKYNKNFNIKPEVIINFFKTYKNNKTKNIEIPKDNIINSKIEIDIYSPFFKILSTNNEIFEKFSIVIPIKYLQKFLKEDYISIFDKLNKLKSNYISLSIYCKDNDDLIKLKDLKINFNQIKSLSINIEETQINYEQFFNILLSLNINNLTDFILNKDIYGEIDPISFEKLNNFTSLENLSLIGVKFSNIFKLKLSPKVLYMDKCENLIFDDITSKNLQKLFLYDSNIFYYAYPNKLIQLPKVEECVLINRCSEISHYCEFIDFSAFENLKILKVEDSDFLNLEKANLEQLTVYSHSYAKRSMNFMVRSFDKRIINKIISIQNLKKIDFTLHNINKEDILKIKENNCSIKKIKFYFSSNSEDIIIPLLNKFPNISKITLLNDSIMYDGDKATTLEIVENINIKINNIKLIIGASLKFYCGLYENIIKINIELLNTIENMKKILPIFNSKCNTIFKSLTYFRFVYHPIEGINSEILNNIYNNIDNMPNIKYFELISITIDDNKELYEKLNKKIQSLHLDKYILAKNVT